jgi:hypothetical protein
MMKDQIIGKNPRLNNSGLPAAGRDSPFDHELSKEAISSVGLELAATGFYGAEAATPTLSPAAV